MLDHALYVPILKGRPSEMAALTKLLLDTSAKDVDLLVDYGPVNAESAKELIKELPSRIPHIPLLKDWRTFALATTAIPQTLASVKAQSMKDFIRHDMDVWSALYRNRGQLKRMPLFSDYTTVHPVFNEIDPRLINKSPSIRYAKAVPADHAFDELRQNIEAIRTQVRTGIRELTTYAHAATAIESTGGVQ